MRLKRVRRVVASVACAAAVLAFGPAAHAGVVVDADVTAGVPLPGLPDNPRTWLDVQAAPGYVAYDDRQPDEWADRLVTIHRLGDGAAVRDLLRSSSASQFWPQLSGDAVVQVLPGSGGLQASGYVVDDLVTGAQRYRIGVPSDDAIVAETASGLLTRRFDGGSSYTEHVLEPDGTDVQVGPSQPLSAWLSVGATDGGTVVQHVGNRLWAIDMTSGQYHDLGTAGWYDQVWLTPHRVIWIGNTNVTTVSWTDRDGGDPGSAAFRPSQYVNRYWPLGDTLIAQVYTGVGSDMDPIDLSTGQLGAPLVSDVINAAVTGDGTLALIVADIPDLHLETLAPGQSAPTVVSVLQERHRTGRAIALDGQTVTVDIGPLYDTSPGPLLANTLGSADWRAVPTPPSPPWPTTWTVTRGGTTWTWHTDSAVISATGAAATVPAPCAAPTVGGIDGSFTVVGRWATVRCRDTGWWVVDLSGRADSWQVPVPTYAFGPLLGNGFVAVVAGRQSDSGSYYEALTVTDLSDQHQSRVYGPVNGSTLPPGPGFAVDAAGGPRVAYLDGTDQPRLVTLDWLPDYGPDDTSGPAVTATGGSGAVSADSPIRATWTATDRGTGVLPASGVASYDVRYRDAASSDWTVPDDLQGVTGTSAPIPAADGRTTCWSVRARDNDGNVGDWSADRCVTTDRTAPRVGSASAGPGVVAAVTTTTVTFRYAATDATGVASYDVSYRVAARGGALGPVTAPASWQRTTATSQKVAVAAGGEACFSVRARDRAGNVSAPSAWACAAVPLDDRSMSASSGTARHLQLGALGGTSTGLTRSGAYVALAGQQGRQLALIALQGPGQGSVDVWAGGVKVGHVNLAYGTWRRVVVLLPVRPFRGTVMVNSVATAESRIDGVAVLR